MLFNPEDGKTMEEVFEIAFRGLKPEHRARVEPKARAAGCSVQEVMEACVMAGYPDAWNDMRPYFELANQPYGKDLLLTQREP